MNKMSFLDCVDVVGSSVKEYTGIRKYVSTGALDCDHIDADAVEEYSFSEKPSRANLEVDEGCLLFAKMQGTKKTLMIDKENQHSIYSTGFAAVRPKDGIITARCLYHLVTSDDFLKQKDLNCSGATQKAITNEGMKKIIVSIPDIEDQERIAKILDKVDELIRMLYRNSSLFDEIVKSRFVEMFGDPIHNTKGLKEATLPELGEFGRGVSKHRPRNAPELLGGEYPLIQTGEIAAADLYIKSYENTYSEIGFRQSKMWKKGTLCITIAANIAKTAILTFDACFPDSVVGFNANEKTDNVFIHYWFSFFQEILEEQAPESAQKNINLKILGDLKVIVPEKTEQDVFVAFVAQTDKSKYCVKNDLLRCLQRQVLNKSYRR